MICRVGTDDSVLLAPVFGMCGVPGFRRGAETDARSLLMGMEKWGGRLTRIEKYFLELKQQRRNLFHVFHGFSASLYPRGFACGWKELERSCWGIIIAVIFAMVFYKKIHLCSEYQVV